MIEISFSGRGGQGVVLGAGRFDTWRLIAAPAYPLCTRSVHEQVRSYGIGGIRWRATLLSTQSYSSKKRPAGKGLDFVVADIPGLIEGAHKGRGMGTRFLKHIERTRLLLLLIDSTSKTPLEDYSGLLDEMSSYESSLLERPRCLVFTKSDLLMEDVVTENPQVNDVFSTCMISAVTGQGLDTLMDTVESKLRELEEEDGDEG